MAEVSFHRSRHNLLLVYYQFEYKGNFYKYGLYYTWVQMLLQIGPVLHLGPIITLVPSTDASKSSFSAGLMVLIISATF